MKVLTHTLVLLLVVAAAVIFPLRRAQQAFHARSAALGFASTRRPVLRRRVCWPRFDFKRANPTQSAFAHDGAAAVQRVPRRRLTFATATAASRFRAPTTSAHQAGAVSQEAHGPVTEAFDCLATAAARRLSQLLRIPFLSPSHPPAVAAQAVADAPVPPPRC